MKKMFLVIMAAVLAIGFSAFTPTSKVSEGYYYLDGTTQVPVDPELVADECPDGYDEQCIIYLEGSPRLIRNSNGTPVLRKFQH